MVTPLMALTHVWWTAIGAAGWWMVGAVSIGVLLSGYEGSRARYHPVVLVEEGTDAIRDTKMSDESRRALFGVLSQTEYTAFKEIETRHDVQNRKLREKLSMRGGLICAAIWIVIRLT